MDAIVKGSQAGIPTRTMRAGRAFRYSNPQDNYKLDRIYKFQHGVMSMKDFINKAYEAVATIDQQGNLTWGTESIGLTASAARYYKFLVDYNG
jgi:hypothetical protein